MQVLFWPRDSNPYQGLLIDVLSAEGIRVSYLGERTRSHTVNLLLLPAEVVAARRHGASVVHLHWLYRFNLPVGRAKSLTRRLSRAWFAVTLGVIRLLGLRLVWTAHNVLPHSQIFPDDVNARIRLLESCDAVIVHSEATTAEIRRRGWPLPARTVTIPPASLVEPPSISRAAARAALNLPPDHRILGMVGRIDRYKGPDVLLRAAAEVTQGADHLSVVIAGRCTDRHLERELEQLAADAGVDVRLDLRELTDQEFDVYLAALDAFVVPFHRATTSGSVATALSAGLVVMVPEHVALGEIPAELITRFEDLGQQLRDWIRRPAIDAAEHRARAMAWARGRTWAEVGAETAELYRSLQR